MSNWREVTCENDLCSFNLTGPNLFPQHWFHCITCFPLYPNKGCCDVCAATCHKGHRLEEGKTRCFFCDCGAGDCPVPCQCRTKKIQDQSTKVIFEEKEEEKQTNEVEDIFIYDPEDEEANNNNNNADEDKDDKNDHEEIDKQSQQLIQPQLQQQIQLTAPQKVATKKKILFFEEKKIVEIKKTEPTPHNALKSNLPFIKQIADDEFVPIEEMPDVSAQKMKKENYLSYDTNNNCNPIFFGNTNFNGNNNIKKHNNVKVIRKSNAKMLTKKFVRHSNREPFHLYV